MASTDNTASVAQSLGARVISVTDYGYVEPAKREAIEAASHEWVMLLDADEIVPPALATTLKQVVEEGACDGVLIPFLTFMMGRVVAHTGWAPQQERHLRLFRRDMVDFPTQTHTEIRLNNGTLKVLPTHEENCIRHYNYRDWSHFLSKLDRYTSLEARHFLDSGRSPSTVRALRTAGVEGCLRFLVRRGYRDGLTGLTLAVLMVAYRLLVFAKARQLTEVGGPDQIRQIYRADAARAGVSSTLG